MFSVGSSSSHPGVSQPPVGNAVNQPITAVIEQHPPPQLHPSPIRPHEDDDDPERPSKRSRSLSDKRRATLEEKYNLLVEFEENYNSGNGQYVTQIDFVRTVRARNPPFNISKTTFNDWWNARQKIYSKFQEGNPHVQSSRRTALYNKFPKASHVTEQHMKILSENGATLTGPIVEGELLKAIQLIPEENEKYEQEPNRSLRAVARTIKSRVEMQLTSDRPPKHPDLEELIPNIKNHITSTNIELSKINAMIDNKTFERKDAVRYCRHAIIEAIDLHNVLVQNDEHLRLNSKNRVMINEVRRVLEKSTSSDS